MYGARVLLGIEPANVEEGLRIDDSEATVGENQMQLYPNPAGNEVTILYPLEKDEKGEIRISSLTGNTVFSKELTSSNNKITISMIRFSSGVYLCSYVKNGTVLERQKLVIIK